MVPRSRSLSPWGRLVLLLLLLLLLLAIACSRDPAAPVTGDPAGVPLTPEGSIGTDSGLEWSPATNELVGTAYSLSAENSLIAVSASTGALRTLDPLASAGARLSRDGTAVVYSTITFREDTARIEVRHRALAAGVPRVIAACEAWLGGGEFCALGGLPGPDADHLVYSDFGDSITLYTLSTGAQRPLAGGVPLLFSPDGAELVHIPFPGHIESAEILSLGSGMSRAAGLSAPGADAVRVHWGTAGLRALYVTGDDELVLHDPASGTHTTIWDSPDSLDAARLSWSPSGRLAAIWSVSQCREGAGNSFPRCTGECLYTLYVVDLGRRDVIRVAQTSACNGAVAFSPADNRIAYIVGTRIYTQFLPVLPPMALP